MHGRDGHSIFLPLPHIGEVWKRLVRSMREVLTALEKYLQTAIIEVKDKVEDITNSRSVTYHGLVEQWPFGTYSSVRSNWLA